MVESHQLLGEYDVVRPLRPLPEYRLPAGATGATVMGYGMYSKADKPAAYEVEFSDADELTQALVTMLGSDLEVVRRGRRRRSR